MGRRRQHLASPADKFVGYTPLPLSTPKYTQERIDDKKALVGQLPPPGGDESAGAATPAHLGRPPLQPQYQGGRQAHRVGDAGDTGKTFLTSDLISIKRLNMIPRSST